jgi:ribonuclease III
MLSKRKPNLQLIADLLQIKPRHTDIWLSALTHKSWLFFHSEVNIQDNEKLEFLGDAVLELIVSEYLYQNFPKFSEGELTFLRAKLVNRERLGKIGEKLGLDKIILFNKKIENKGRLTILGNSLEAIIGALYLDFGYEKAKEFVIKNVIGDLRELMRKEELKDPKTLLQEEIQKDFNVLPEYRVVKEEGKEHEKLFFVEVYFQGRKIGSGVGSSKQKAEIEAALDALKHRRWLKQE